MYISNMKWNRLHYVHVVENAIVVSKIEGVTMHRSKHVLTKEESRLCVVDGWIDNRCVHVSKPTVTTATFVLGE